MSELESIQAAVKRAARRRRWQRSWRGFWQSLLIGACVWLLTLGVYKLVPISFNAVIVSGIVAGAGLIIGFLYGWLRPMSLEETARWLDEKQHLQERLSTALEFVGKPADEDWKQLLISDAAQHAKDLDPRRLLPFHLPKSTRWALLVLAMGVGLGFVPEYRSKAYVQKQKEEEVIKEAGAKVLELTRRNLENRQPSLEKTKEVLSDAEKLGEELSQRPVTRTEALKDLASVTDKLKNELKELGKDPATKSLERAARESSRSGSTVPSETQKKIDDLQKSLGDKAGNPEALDKLKKDLERLGVWVRHRTHRDDPLRHQ